MIDPFDAALSEFIDTLPQDAQAAQDLLDASAPFTGQGDLPALAELTTVLRSVPPYEPRPEWVAASKARLMAAPLLPPEKRGFTWLGSMFLPLTHLSWPSFSLPQLPQLVPSPMFARAAVALGIVFTLASVARDNQGQNPILQVTTSQAPVENAEQAISSAQQEMARLAYQGQVAGVEVKGSPRDVVLLSKSFELAEEAIDKAPPAEQPRLRSQLQSSIRAVRFDGLLEGITNGSTLQVAGVAIQADAATAQQLRVGQAVSVLVTVGSGGKLLAVQVAPNDPAPSAAPSAPASAAPAASSLPLTTSGGTAPQTSSTNKDAVAAASPAAVPASSPQTSAPTRGRDASEPVQTSSRVSSRSNNSPAVAVTAPTEPVIAAKVDKPDKPDKGDASDQAPGSISVVAGAATSPPQASAAAAAAQAAAAAAVQSAQDAASAQTAAGGAQVSGSGPQSGGAQGGAASAGSAGQAALQAAAAAQSRAQQAQSAAAERASQAVARTLQAREMPQLSVSLPSPSSDKGKAKDAKDIIKSKK